MASPGAGGSSGPSGGTHGRDLGASETVAQVAHQDMGREQVPSVCLEHPGEAWPRGPRAGPEQPVGMSPRGTEGPGRGGVQRAPQRWGWHGAASCRGSRPGGQLGAHGRVPEGCLAPSTRPRKVGQVEWAPERPRQAEAARQETTQYKGRRWAVRGCRGKGQWPGVQEASRRAEVQIENMSTCFRLPGVQSSTRRAWGPSSPRHPRPAPSHPHGWLLHPLLLQARLDQAPLPGPASPP